MRALARIDGEAYRLSNPAQWVREPRRDDWVRSSPAPMFRHITVAFDKSRHILEMEDDWDEAGSPRISYLTWNKAVAFLAFHAAMLWEGFGVVLPAPRVLAGPGGSIDLHWKTGARELLINIPAAAGSPANFYGDDFGSNQKRGSIEQGHLNVSLFAWLTIQD